MNPNYLLLSLFFAGVVHAAPCTAYGSAGSGADSKEVVGVVSAVGFDYTNDILTLNFDSLTVGGEEKTCLTFAISFLSSGAVVAQGLHKQALLSMTLGYLLVGHAQSSYMMRGQLELRKP